MKEIHFKTIDSTNKYVKEHINEIDSLTFVSADFQSKGRGRGERTWNCNENEGLMFSFALKEKNITSNFQYVSLMAAYIVSEVIKSLGIDNVSIKWPNDVYIGDKKVCGILLEGSLPDYLIVGIGININQKEFVGEYRISPTSLYIENKKEIDFNTFKNNLYNLITEFFENFDAKKDAVIKKVMDIDYLKNKECIVTSYNPLNRVKVIGIKEDCTLEIKDGNNIFSINSGEINY